MQEVMRDSWFKYIRNIEEDYQEPQSKSKLWSFTYETAAAISSAVVVIFVLFTFIFRAVGVVGDSMLPTLSNGDWLLVSANESVIERGDVVIITEPNKIEKSLVKRVIAVENDVVNIDFYTHTVSVNGEVLTEDYILEPTEREGDVEFPLTVGKGEVFVLGDNRNNSVDSRSTDVGCVDEDYILGVAKYKLLPKFSKIG